MSNNYFSKLTKGAIGHILEGRKIDEPILQMLAFKNMPTDNTPRYRLVLSDGAYSYQCCIIMGDLAIKVENGEFDRYCLLKVSRYMLNEIQSRQVIVLADPKLLVKGSSINEKLGDPVPFGSENAPPLSNFKPNYHINVQSDMDVEFENDIFEMEKAPATRMSNHNSSPKRMKNDRGQPSNRNFTNASNNTGPLNPELACPIASLSPYSTKWLIKGRCIAKTSKRSWSNAKGEGVLFSFDLQDGSSDIRLTAFKAECDKFFDLIKVGGVYLVSRGQVKNANRQFSRSTSEYEIGINSDTAIELCEDNSNCPAITYNFVPFENLNQHFGGFSDIIGVIKSIGDVETVIRKKNNKELFKRNLTLVDQNRSEIVLTVWDEHASNFTGEVEDVVVVRACRVSDYNGISLSLTTNSILEINPEIEEVMELKGWYSRVKDDLETTSLTTRSGSGFVAKWNNLCEINQNNILQNDNVFVLQTKATISQMGKANVYKACSCNKKLTDLNNGFYRCDKCQTEVDKFNWRIIMTFSVSDHTKTTWVQAFHEDSVKLLNKSIEELGLLYESSQSEFDDFLKTVNFKSYIFKLRARMEHFNDNEKIRTQVSGIYPIIHKDYGNYLLESIIN